MSEGELGWVLFPGYAVSLATRGGGGGRAAGDEEIEYITHLRVLPRSGYRAILKPAVNEGPHSLQTSIQALASVTINNKNTFSCRPKTTWEARLRRFT